MDLEGELLKRFGYPQFRPGQRRLIEAILAGEDALGVMPTGGGKSLCFQFPGAVLEGTALVISPLIALMKDQVDALRARGIQAEFYNSTMKYDERFRVEEAVQSGRVRLLYMAPERMQQVGFMDLLAHTPISVLAIDEAHCISHWGHDFRPDYRRIGELRKFLRGPDPTKKVPVIALTATATQRVQVDIVERLGMKSAVQVITGFRRRNLSFEVKKCSGRAEKLRVLRELIDQALADGGSAVIYAATRKNVELVAEELQKSKSLSSWVSYYHAGLSDQARVRVQDQFINGVKRVLIATNAFGMGIDKANVRLVAHYDIPGSVEAYYQEAGRAGRDSKPARCILLFNFADVATQEFFIEKGVREEMEDGEEFPEHVKNQKELLKQLVRYAYGTTCRQKLILGYFGDPETQEFAGCGNCDCCKPETRPRFKVEGEVLLACRKALSAAARINDRFGKNRLAELLKGSQTAGLKTAGLQHLPVYGLLKDQTLGAIRELIDSLTDAGYLRITGLDYPVIGLTPAGIRALKQQEEIELTQDFGGGQKQKRFEEQRPKAPRDSGVLETLREFRREEALRRKVPAYLIFHDKTLEELAERRPDGLDELSEISGMGPKKLELYGEKILTILTSSQ